MKGFITIEGCEGVGKSTQFEKLKAYLKGQDVVFTREPGGTRIAEDIRSIILKKDNAEMDEKTELFLYAAARAQHIREIIAPALKEGKRVFCDRYVDSTYAYQGYGRNLGLEFVGGVNRYAVGDYMPEYTVFLDLPPKSAFLRKGGADPNDRLEQQNLAFHERVYEGYRELIRREPARFLVVDASGSKEETFQKMIAILKKAAVL